MYMLDVEDSPIMMRVLSAQAPSEPALEIDVRLIDRDLQASSGRTSALPSGS